MPCDRQYAPLFATLLHPLCWQKPTPNVLALPANACKVLGVRKRLDRPGFEGCKAIEDGPARIGDLVKLGNRHGMDVSSPWGDEMMRQSETGRRL